MINNSPKINDHEDLKSETINKKLAVRCHVNFISTRCLTYRGSCNKAFFFSWEVEQYLIIVILQQFSLNGQTKILKQWETNFKTFTLIDKSNQFFASDESVGSLWEIDCAYNQKVIDKTLFSYDEKDNWFFKKVKQFIQNSFLVLSVNNDLIVTSNDMMIHFIIKQNNGIWKVQQIEDLKQFELINDYSINYQGNMLIVSVDTHLENILDRSKLLIYLRTKTQWKRIKEIDFPRPHTYCFVDNDKFAYLEDNLKCLNIIIWQVFQDTLEVEIVQQHQLLTQDLFTRLIYINDRDLFLALSYNDIYYIKQVNNKLQLLETIQISEGFKLENLINGEFLIFKNYFKRTQKVSKLYGF